jgi:hypothetical protein
MAHLVCVESFVVWDSNSIPHSVSAGQVIDDKDWRVKGREFRFEPVESTVERRREVEQATRAPGEKRTAKKV